MNRCTVRGEEPSNPANAPAPTDARLPDGQHADHWAMCPGEIIKAGFMRPVRLKYQHVGAPGPKFPTRDLTQEEKARWGETDQPFVKFEPYPERHRGSSIGRYWTQEQIDNVGKGCGVVTSMPLACAETYAANPGYYGSTFCCGCGSYLPVGQSCEFVWDGTQDRVGT